MTVTSYPSHDGKSTLPTGDMVDFTHKLTEIHKILIQTAKDASGIADRIEDSLTGALRLQKANKADIRGLLEQYGAPAGRIPRLWKVYSVSEVEMIVSLALLDAEGYKGPIHLCSHLERG